MSMTASSTANMVKNSRSVLKKFFHPLKNSYFVSFIAAAVLTLFVTSLPAATNIPSLEVDDVVKVLVDRADAVKSYRAKLHLVIQDPDFLKEFFWDKDAAAYTPHPACFGMLCSSEGEAGGGATIYLNYGSLEYQCFSVKGGTVSYAGLRRIRNIEKKPNSYKDLPYQELLPLQTEDNGVMPTPEPTPGLKPLPSKYTALDPRAYGSVPNHPLSFVVPYILQKKGNIQSIKVLSDKAPVLGKKCALLEVRESNSQFITKLWVDVKQKQILQVETYNPETNCTISALYLGFYQEEGQERFAIYNRVQINCNGLPVFMAELSDPDIDYEAKAAKAKEKEEQAKASRYSKYSLEGFISNVKPVLLSKGMRNIVSLLCLCLVVLGFRYILYRVSRQEFSDELIVVDEEDGRFAEMLSKMGYRTVAFSSEVVSEERNFLGKGATEDTSYRPRAIVVAPDSFQFIHNYLFLIRAYVEEGGRVLVMYHPQKSNGDLPYQLEEMPMTQDNQGFFFDFKKETLTNVKSDSIKHLAKLYTGKEVVLSVDGKKFNERLIWCTNMQSKLEATIVGMVRQGKGEYIICQMQFTPSITVKNANMQFLLNDIFRYLLGLEPIQTDNTK
ncbi:MAG: hypothetical protein ACI376_04040 [Candidatus Bruticola sp.]